MNSKAKSALIHSILFIVTFITTTLAGVEWTYGKSIFMEGYSFNDFASGLPYSISFLFILTAHELGHYFTAIYNRIKTTLPYYIPFPPIVSFNIGTLGALIRLKGIVRYKQQHFDIGIAGPLAGFVAAMIVLVYAYTHLPPNDYIYQFHPEYEKYGAAYADFVYRPENSMPNTFDVVIGKNLLFIFLEKLAPDASRVPNVHEIMHYPLIFAGFLSLVFTFINLLPIGQLDGGHVLYGLLGSKKHNLIATIFFVAFLFYAGLGYITPRAPMRTLIYEIPLFILFNYVCLTGLKLSKINTLTIATIIFATQYTLSSFFPWMQGYSGWLLFILIIGRFVGIAHPTSQIEEPLSDGRKIVGWIAVLIFVLCFTPYPIEITVPVAPLP